MLSTTHPQWAERFPLVGRKKVMSSGCWQCAQAPSVSTLSRKPQHLPEKLKELSEEQPVFSDQQIDTLAEWPSPSLRERTEVMCGEHVEVGRAPGQACPARPNRVEGRGLGETCVDGHKPTFNT